MISAVIPVFNEQESLVPLHAEIVETAKQAGLDLEVLFVDDGSTDGSWDVIAGLARTTPTSAASASAATSARRPPWSPASTPPAATSS